MLVFHNAKVLTVITRSAKQIFLEQQKEPSVAVLWVPYDKTD